MKTIRMRMTLDEKILIDNYRKLSDYQKMEMLRKFIVVSNAKEIREEKRKNRRKAA